MAWYNPFSWGEDKNTTGIDAAQKYLSQAEPMLRQNYSPYMQQGQRAMPILEEQFGQLLNNPQMMMQNWGQGFEESPGYQFQMEQMMNAANGAAAAGGMLGTNAHQQQAMGYAGGLANQDYYNYLDRIGEMYGQGLSGYGGLYDAGFNATQGYSSGMGNALGSQANLAYTQGANTQNMFGSALGAGLGAIGSIWGPGGAMAGKWAGDAIGNKTGNR